MRPTSIIFNTFAETPFMILVTGGTGLLGSHLLFELVSSGKKVRAIRRRPGREALVRKVFGYYSTDAGELFSRIEWFDADLMDFGAMEDAIDGVKEVYHVGAVVSFYPKDHKTMLKVNIEGTANLVNLAIHHGVEKFCYVSSVSTLGRADNDGLSDEETYWVPSRKNSVYSQSKYGAEREIWRGMEEGLNAVIVLPSVIIGPGYWQENSGLFRLVHQGLKYATRGVNGYVDARDVCRAMVLLMENNCFGERFIASAGNFSYLEFFTMVARHMNKPAPSVIVPPLLTGLAWRVEALRCALTGSKPEVTREMAITTSQVYTYNNRKIRDRLRFEFRDADDSIRETCEIFLKDYCS
jgi:dihydroflavonol-4-reductase